MTAHPGKTFSFTKNSQSIRIGAGQPIPFGATVVPGGVNFSIFSQYATDCILVLFRPNEAQPFTEIPFPQQHRIGHVFTMQVYDLDWENVEYGYRFDGPDDIEAGHRFDPDVVVLDPYAKSITGRGLWKQQIEMETPMKHRGRIVESNFDWEDDRPLNLPIEDLIIYEMHVRSFTEHPSSGVRNPGTYAGLVEKIPYLKELGINAVELLPIFDFNEYEHSRQSPITGELLVNYWGYSTVNFFAPKASFAASGERKDEINEFKWMVKSLHQAGIEVILDVVYNHTAEGNENGPTLSFRGIDNKTYYILTPEGYYQNFSGTGNTFNCNHPAVIQFIIDSLRYWVTEFHIDGFRFDLAAILARSESGGPLADPPLLKHIAHDPILGKTKLIAEPWDAGGLYYVGSFPAYGRWAEWNGKYRDSMRRFLKGDEGTKEEVLQRLSGSRDLYSERGPIASVNFFTAHDGFTLYDLVSYNDKHNEANGEDNRDGTNDNHSWNCGCEGETEDIAINALRLRQMKNAMVMLLVSQGIPMFLMGDEVGRTQKGNNNTYCQDNDLNYFDWRQVETKAEFYHFVSSMIQFRHRHAVLRHGWHLRSEDYQNIGQPDITWYKPEIPKCNKKVEKLTVAFLLSGEYAKGGLAKDNDIYVAMNMHWEPQNFKLPKLPKNKAWHVFANTSMSTPQDIHPIGSEPHLKDQQHLMVESRAVVVLLSK
jgi:isoamylase